MFKKILQLAIISALFCACEGSHKSEGDAEEDFPKQLVEFKPYPGNPVFTAGDSTAWDRKIRERGFIIKEDSVYKLWYTGFASDDTQYARKLGYATSLDGINWTRYPGNPVFDGRWTEDMFVFRDSGMYYMYAEGTGDVAHYLESQDGIKWTDRGDLVIIKTNGDTLAGPYGTPVVHVENGKWYLFYEINDEAIWLATSDDKRTWRNVQDEPVLKPGPEKFDLGAVAADQIVKYKDRFYMLYHANADPMWTTKPTPWSSNIAVSDDLVHWKKYTGNPITDGDHSSPVAVWDGQRYRLYTMHPEGWVFFGE